MTSHWFVPPNTRLLLFLFKKGYVSQIHDSTMYFIPKHMWAWVFPHLRILRLFHATYPFAFRRK